MFWLIIQFLIAVALFCYVCGLLLDFFYELKITSLYKQKQSAIHCAERIGKSMAVVHAKTFKIEMDYTTKTLIAERRRKFIRNLVLNR